MTGGYGFHSGVERYLEFHPETVRYMVTHSLEYRKALGQFFTPKSVRMELLGRLPRLVRPKILDPACGSGEFLLSAREYFIEPELYCWEIDCKLAGIAKKIVGEAVVECVDSLRKPFKEEFDVVIGNPPYFRFKPDRFTREKFKRIISGEANIFAFFVYLGLRMLKPGGYLAYVVSSSLNNGACFRKLREYIVRNAEIEYLKVLEDTIFEEVRHFFQLLVLRKTQNTGKYVFRHGDIMIFSEKADMLSKIFNDPNTRTLRELGYRVKTGKVKWEKNRDKLTVNPEEGVLLVWAHNIKNGKLEIANRPGKPQYIRLPLGKTSKGPVIAVTRITGHPRKAVIEACLIPPGLRFIPEHHVNIVYPPLNASIEEMEEIVRHLNSKEVQEVVRIITGNSEISKTVLENLIPIKLDKLKTPSNSKPSITNL